MREKKITGITARLRIFRGDSRHVETRSRSVPAGLNFASLQGFWVIELS
jgi:hypothetical protein